jgi:hypothetical protein
MGQYLKLPLNSFGKLLVGHAPNRKPVASLGRKSADYPNLDGMDLS